MPKFIFNWKAWNKNAVSSVSHVVTILIAILVFCFYYSQNQKLPFEWIVYIFPLTLGSLFPDVLDYKKSPNHRSILGHGYFLVYAIIFVVIPLNIYFGLKKSYVYFHFAAFFIGFLWHLLIDALGKKGLV